MIPTENVKKYCVCIQGSPLNWAWSLKEFEAESIGVSAAKENPPPNLSKKQYNQILWAFRQDADYNRLKTLVNESGYVKTALVTTKEGIPQLEGGVIGFGEIYKDDLIGRLKWEYWPSGTDWDHKFFIRITRLGPKIVNSLGQLKNWHSMSKDQIISIISEWNESIISIVPKSLTQGSLAVIDEKTYEYLNFIANLEWKPKEKQETSKEKQETMEDLEAVIAAHLISGKNVIIYGPPGVGKTTLAKKICEDLTSGYYSVTGNPEWTVFDVIGGRSLTGEFRFGFLSEAVVKCWKTLVTENKPYWLLIDEINRTNADLAFGNAFTTMDLLHRGTVPLLSLSPIEKEKLPDEGKKHFEDSDLFTPYSFRIVSTMNSYDRALLFKLGFALIRRFALIPMSLKPYTLEEMDEKFVEKAKALVGETKAEQSNLYGYAKQELLLCRDNLKDFLVIKEDYFNKLNSGLVDNYFNGVNTAIGFSPFDLLEAICIKINSEMEGAVEIGKAFSLDASKFLIAAYLMFEDTSKIMKALVDEAVAAYIIPQLDVLSEKVRAERMGLYADMRISKKIESLTHVFSDMNLSFRTVPLLKRILAGERVL
jgi:5-methylcytosine-specific restriction endonuclease McrBC GTP-binding regulatory subunit McrB